MRISNSWNGGEASKDLEGTKSSPKVLQVQNQAFFNQLHKPAGVLGDSCISAVI